MSAATADVVIIGAGSIGAFAALQLRKRGKSVVVLDRGSIGGQSSGVSPGSLRLQGRHPDEMALSMHAQALWEETEALIGESVEFDQSGHLFLALNPSHVDRLKGMAPVEARYGNACEMLDRDEVLRRWPFLRSDVLGGSFNPRSATVNSRLVTPAVARAATRLGADFCENVEVAAVRRLAEHFVVETASGDRLEADHVINAAGAWALPIAQAFGETAPMFAAGPPQIVTEPLAQFVKPVIHSVDGEIIFRQTPRGSVIIAGHPRIPVDAERRRSRVPPYKMLTNMRRLLGVAARMRPHSVVRVWTGIEGYLPDMLPVFGPSRAAPGLIHAFGWSGHGLQVAPAVGEELARLVTEGKTLTPIEPFTITRFREGRTIDAELMRREFDDKVAVAGRSG